jgi:REP element-mobilizing transposase RayT
MFHVVTNTKGGVPWCVLPGVPEVLIDNLMMTRNLYGAEVYAFCVLPNHMHILLEPGERGLSNFMHSFKRNSSKDVRQIMVRAGNRTRATGEHIPTRSRGSVTPASVEKKPFTGWQNGFYDEEIMTNTQRDHAIRYVEENAVGHCLTKQPQDWQWTSIHFEHLLNPMPIWF